MGKLALITKVGEEDTGVDVSGREYLKTGNLKMFTASSSVSVHALLSSLKKLKLEPSEVAMDLLVVASTMYAADTRIDRKTFGEDSWTRIIDLYIPVSDPVRWSNQSDRLQKIFRFLTGDIWTLYFRPRTNMPILSPRGNRKKYKMPYNTDTVCLFSGGMDSFIGAIDLLERGIRPLLVGHSKSADVAPYQSKCAAALASHYNNIAPQRIHAFLSIPKEDLFDSLDNTERGRSFLFLTLGGVCASSLNQTSTLVIPENGMISLNLPLTPLRIGSHSTRTTHPYYLKMMQELFSQLGLGVTLHNPYQFKTKGEMLIECANQSLVINTETMSCSHPAAGRYQGGVGSSNKHCGYCVPCIIRQSSFRAASQHDPFPYGVDLHSTPIDIKTAKGADVIAFKYMIEKVKRHPSYLTAAIRNTGRLGTQVQRYVDVYSRALNEVDQFLNGVTLTA
ncbi:Qat anti-phage system QueC-like protein QatC [Segetibacter koreensis]|uniref:Qat anti-phage system QueC-like protein QatC n=1 Tax=Segetibacter koreensis TaxID=398037 RepID=UPI00037C5039|nr:Qat anti-phage system QueC-like protein QatC [Segetibacter koreensis]